MPETVLRDRAGFVRSASATRTLFATPASCMFVREAANLERARHADGTARQTGLPIRETVAAAVCCQEVTAKQTLQPRRYSLCQ